MINNGTHSWDISQALKHKTKQIFQKKLSKKLHQKIKHKNLKRTIKKSSRKIHYRNLQTSEKEVTQFM